MSKKASKWQRYERAKQCLMAFDLSPAVYEAIVRIVADALGL